MSRPRRQVVAAAVATALVLATAAVIVTVGGVTLPSYPSMRDDPFPGVDGQVAFLREDDEGRGRCLHVVPADASTAPRRLHCDELFWPVVWEDDGTIAVESHSPVGPERLHVDPATGDVVAREEPPMEEPEPPRGLPVGDRAERSDGTSLVIAGRERRAEVLRVEPDGSRTVLLEWSGYGSFRWQTVGWSPHGRWAVVSDSEDRVLVVDPDDGDARLLVDDASDPAWGPAG